MSQYNLRSPAVKRLMREAEELRYPTKEYYAQPLDDNLFEWHFTLGGPPNTEFEKGVYHGRITLPPEYPMKPPSIILLTPNGRFDINKKICLSISGYHPESWQPSWSIRTALLALIGFLPTHGNGAIGSLDYTPEERKELALKSQNWKCPQCGNVKEHLAEKEINMPSTGKTLSSNEDENLHALKTSKLIENSRDDDTLLPNIVAPPKANTSSNLLTPSTHISQEGETILRHRQPSLPLQDNRSNASPNTVNNWSLHIIWVIVLLLGILILRRILYL